MRLSLSKPGALRGPARPPLVPGFDARTTDARPLCTQDARHDKALGIVTDAVRDRGLSLPAAALMASLVAAFKARGDGGLDHSALYKLATELNGMDATTEA